MLPDDELDPRSRLAESGEHGIVRARDHQDRERCLVHGGYQPASRSVRSRELDAGVDLGDGLIAETDGALAMAALVGLGAVKLCARGGQVVACGGHVWLIACSPDDDDRTASAGE